MQGWDKAPQPRTVTCKPTAEITGLEFNTHTHPFNGPFSGTTHVGWYQKGKTNLAFTESRDCKWFYRPDALPAAQPTAS